MTRDDLLQRYQEFPDVPGHAAEAYHEHAMAMADTVTALVQDHPQRTDWVDDDRLSMMADNHRNHGLFIASHLNAPIDVVFVDTILWALRAYRSHGFGQGYWPVQIAAWQTAVRQHLPSTCQNPVTRFYDVLARQLPDYWEASTHANPGLFGEHDQPSPPIEHPSLRHDDG